MFSFFGKDSLPADAKASFDQELAKLKMDIKAEDQKRELIKKVIKETPGPKAFPTAYLFNCSNDEQRTTKYDILESNTKDSKFTPSIIGQGSYTFLQYKNLFLLRKSSLTESMHGWLYSKIESLIQHSEIQSAGDILVNTKGNILYCRPQSGGFKGEMKDHLKQIEAKGNSAENYKTLINMPGVVLYDCTFGKPLKVFNQFFTATGTPLAVARSIALDKQAKKPLLERLKKLGPNILVDEERFNNLKVEFSLKFLTAFADEYEKTYKNTVTPGAAAAPDEFTPVMPGSKP